MAITTNLLIAERPINVSPTLARRIGLHGAIVLSALLADAYDAGDLAVATNAEWRRDRFPFWDAADIERAFADLAGRGLVYPTDCADGPGYQINPIELTRLVDGP